MPLAARGEGFIDRPDDLLKGNKPLPSFEPAGKGAVAVRPLAARGEGRTDRPDDRIKGIQKETSLHFQIRMREAQKESDYRIVLNKAGEVCRMIS